VPVAMQLLGMILRLGWVFTGAGDCTNKPMRASGGVSAGRRWHAVNAVDRAIGWSTALAVVGVAGIAAVVSYENPSALVRAHGESGWTGRDISPKVDGLIYVSSMARRGVRVPATGAVALVLGVVATLASNVAHGWGHGVLGAAVGGAAGGRARRVV
jgi:hypothetical protein